MSIRLIQQLSSRFGPIAKSYLFSGGQIRVGNLLITNRSGLNVNGEVLVSLKPGADPTKVLNAIEDHDQNTPEVRRDFYRVLLVGPANDRNLPKIPPKGVYRIAYHLLTQRKDTDVVIYDPNYWYNTFPPLLERPYDVVGYSSLFSSFVHDAELMAALREKYPAIKSALNIVGGMTATHWGPEQIFSTPVDLAVKGFGGERIFSEILDRLPQYSDDLMLFADLEGVMVRGHANTYGKLPTFYRQADFATVVPGDFRLVPYHQEQDIIGHHGYFRQQENPFRPLNEVGLYPLHLLSFQMICQGRCIFCSSMARNFLAAMRQHGQKPLAVRISPEDVICLIKEAVTDNPSIDNIRFDEDNFLFDPKAAKQFAELMKENGLDRYPWKIKTRSDHIVRNPQLAALLRQAGCYGLDLGFENGSQRILDKMRKGITIQQNRQTVEILTRVGFKVIQLNYILFTPDSTIEDIKATMEEAIEYGLLDGVFINLLPYMIALPGAPLMSMPEYQSLITYKKKTLPGGVIIQKPSAIKTIDQATRQVLEQTLAQLDQEIAAYEQSLRERDFSFRKTPEYIYPFLFFRTVYGVLSDREKIRQLDELIEKLLQATKRNNE